MGNISHTNDIIVFCIYKSRGTLARAHEYHFRDKTHTHFGSSQDSASDAKVFGDIRHSTAGVSLRKSVVEYSQADIGLHVRSQFGYHASSLIGTEYPK